MLHTKVRSHHRLLRRVLPFGATIVALLLTTLTTDASATTSPNSPPAPVKVEPPSTTAPAPTTTANTSTTLDTLPPAQPPTTTTTTATAPPTASETTVPAQGDGATTPTLPTSPVASSAPVGALGSLLDDPTLSPVCASLAKPIKLRPGRPCRLVAYYGTPLSKGMGILGRLPREQVVPAIRADVARWQAADPDTDHVCAFEVIAITAQAAPGVTGLYRARITPNALNEMIALARESSCLIILDLQVGWSSVPVELPYFIPFLLQPDVHLALDPEWDMQPGVRPGTKIGSMEAGDINNAISVLRQIVRTPIPGQPIRPKLLIVHRFRDFMIQNPEQVAPTPEIRLLANMDGFGPPRTKLNVYNVVLRGLKTSLTGFKLFTKLDTPMLQPKVLVGISPAPMFINYQ
jgi:hypothetical protein